MTVNGACKGVKPGLISPRRKRTGFDMQWGSERQGGILPALVGGSLGMARCDWSDWPEQDVFFN
jgi:hypothetical protein